ncbi:YgaP-like transmembrane domain [Phenylobacterium sp.]|uniref:YgaP-like transmembrane domain n=1 Tax=Phenylobacterium sp. TaxID=1871053 RepID=UPI00286D1E15|nr:YgaP-like transmembrane domain [Phenylobacterium sp.]
MPATLTPMKPEIVVDRVRAGQAGNGVAFVLKGGVDGWVAAGLPEIMRQAQIAAGSLAVAGVMLDLAVHPAFHGLSAFVGASLVFAGATGSCAMARRLSVMPWNTPARV